jgi:hypothetical protein
LIKAGESLDLVLATIARDAPTKCRQRQMRHDVGKFLMALLHRGQPARGHRKLCPDSQPNRNRDRLKVAILYCPSKR